MRKLWIAAFAVVLLCACEMAPQVNMSRLTKTSEDYRVAKIKPPKSVVRKLKPRVVVLPFSDTTGYSGCRLGSIATEVIQNVVASSGSYRVVERTKARAIARELGYQETHGMDISQLEKRYFALGKGIKYAVVGSVTSASAVPKNNQVTAEISLYVRVIDFSKGAVVQAFEVKGQTVQNAGISYCSAFQRALEDAVTCPLLIKLREVIPQYGYIKEIRTFRGKEKTYKVAFTNLGSSDGIRPGDKMKILRIERFVDPVSRRVSYRYIEIGEGIVAQNGLGPSESMLVVEDPVVMSALRVGHLVRPTAARVQGKCAGKHFLQMFNTLMKQMGTTNQGGY